MLRPLASACVLIAAAVTLAVAADPVGEFVRRHWAAPIAPQGPPPPGWSPLESALAPEACGTCHPVQYGDWRTSIHAASMGPGIAGQLVEMEAAHRGSTLECHTCHAPLAEQAALTRTRSGVVANPSFDPALGGRGVVCAGCHVRGHQRFGPPRRDGSLTGPAPRAKLPHRGVTRTPAFLSSEFCRGCHQFTAKGFALNGKLLQDTYAEWRASPFAREGVHCQDCHMPDRRHLWRGIHDRAMVASGVEVSVTPDTSSLAVGRDFAVTLELRNTRVGHAFPTYVTPRVLLRGELLEAVGPVAGSRREVVVAREVALDLSRELSDTRLLPGQSARLTYAGRVARPETRLRLSVIVEPDAFYTAFFETLLAQGAGRGEAQIREALEASRRSPFTLFEREIAFGAPAASLPGPPTIRPRHPRGFQVISGPW
jgi:cytochrome c554/c'-like protein